MTVTTLLPATELTKTRQQILALVPPIKAEVGQLTITTDREYLVADVLLARIRTAKSWWLKGDQTGTWKGIDAIIRPFKEGLDGLYELKNDGLKPLTSMEDDVKTKMKAFKLLEAARLDEERQAREKEAARLQAEIDAKQRREDAAKTTQMREKMIAQRMELESQQKAVEKVKAAPVKAAGSAARTTKKPVVVDFAAFAQGVMALCGEEGFPLDLLQVNPVRLAQMWKDQPDLVAQLPGIYIQSDVIIAGR